MSDPTRTDAPSAAESAEPQGPPMEHVRPQIGPNADGHNQQAALAQAPDDAARTALAAQFAAVNVSAAADVARTLPQQPASVNPGTVVTAPGEPPVEPPVEPTPDQSNQPTEG